MKKFVTHLSDVLPYSPPGHSHTTNYRLLGPGPSGSDRFEVVLGEIKSGGRAEPHAHEGIEQAMFILEGKASVEVEGESEVVGPRDLIHFSPGVRHQITALEGRPLRFLIVYAPPLTSLKNS